MSRSPGFYVGCIVPLYRLETKSAAGTETTRKVYEEGALVLEAAPASLKIDVPHPSGEGRGAWFVFSPGTAIHGKMHGVPPSFALFADIAWV